MKVGDRVYFGRAHGEQTLGEVVKINAASIKVKQLEARGTMRDYKVGTIWKVAPTFVQLVDDADPQLKELDRQALGLPLKTPQKRPESVIMNDILACYNGLSPENLHCDGEISVAQARRKGAELRRKLQVLFNELGRQVSEAEAYQSRSA